MPFYEGAGILQNMIAYRSTGIVMTRGRGYMTSYLSKETTDELVEIHLRTALSLEDSQFALISVIHSDSSPPTEKQKAAYRLASVKAGNKFACYCAVAIGRPGFLRVVRAVVTDMFQSSFGFRRPCGFFEGLEQISLAVQYVTDHATEEKFFLDTKELQADLAEVLPACE